MAAPNNTSMIIANVTLNSPAVPKLGRCFVPVGLSLEFQRSFRYHTAAVSLPFIIVLTVICVVTNAAIIVSVLKKVTHIKPRLLLICILALSDLCWGFSQCHTIWAIIVKIQTGGGCVSRLPLLGAYHVAYQLCFTSSIGSLVLMSIDCYLCVSKALAYRSIVTLERVIKVIIIFWLLVIIDVIIYSHASWDIRSVLNSTMGGVFALLILVFQCLVFRAYRKHSGAVADQFQGSGGSMTTRNLAIERKIAISIVYLLATLVIAYVPRILAPLFSAMLGYKVDHMLAPFSILSLLSCATVRPIVTYNKNTYIQDGVKKLLRRRTANVVATVIQPSA